MSSAGPLPLAAHSSFALAMSVWLGVGFNFIRAEQTERNDSRRPDGVPTEQTIDDAVIVNSVSDRLARFFLGERATDLLLRLQARYS